MSASAGRPLALRNPALVKLIRNLYNFMHVDENSITNFPSFNDQIYYFRGIPTPLQNLNKSPDDVPNGIVSECVNIEGVQVDEFIFKIFNSSFTPLKHAEGYSAIWTHLLSKGFDYTEQIVTKQGRTLATVTAQELSQFETEASQIHDGDTPFAVRVMKYISGELFDNVDKKYLTPRLMYNVGAFVGKVDAALNDGFHNSAIEERKNLDWDLAYLPGLRKHLLSLDDPTKRAMVERVLTCFEDFVLPRMPSFMRGIVHGDPNGMNIILSKSDSKDEYEIAGLIDFDDAMKSCMVFDLAILLAYAMLENLNPICCSSPIEFVNPILNGYLHTFPLTSEEVSSLYYLVLGRCCQSAVMCGISYKAEPWNDYLLTSPKKCWVLMEILLSMGKENVDKIWATALEHWTSTQS